METNYNKSFLKVDARSHLTGAKVDATLSLNLYDFNFLVRKIMIYSQNPIAPCNCGNKTKTYTHAHVPAHTHTHTKKKKTLLICTELNVFASMKQNNMDVATKKIIDGKSILVIIHLSSLDQ